MCIMTIMRSDLISPVTLSSSHLVDSTANLAAALFVPSWLVQVCSYGEYIFFVEFGQRFARCDIARP